MWYVTVCIHTVIHFFLQFLNKRLGISGHIHRLLAGSMAGAVAVSLCCQMEWQMFDHGLWGFKPSAVLCLIFRKYKLIILSALFLDDLIYIFLMYRYDGRYLYLPTGCSSSPPCLSSDWTPSLYRHCQCFSDNISEGIIWCVLSLYVITMPIGILW